MVDGKIESELEKEEKDVEREKWKIGNK